MHTLGNLVAIVLLAAPAHSLIFQSNPVHRLPIQQQLSSRPRVSPLRAVPIDGLGEIWSQYLSLLESDVALPTKAVTAAVIIGSGDATAQFLEKRKAQAAGVDSPSPDLARVCRWAAFGLLVQAPWNHFFYEILDGALPPTADPFTLLTYEKVAIDQFVQAPVFTAIIFVFFALVEGRSLADAKKQIDEDLIEVLLKNWAVFLPATFFNLAFLPNELRVLFLNGVFFFWTIFLSLTVNSKKD